MAKYWEVNFPVLPVSVCKNLLVFCTISKGGKFVAVESPVSSILIMKTHPNQKFLTPIFIYGLKWNNRICSISPWFKHYEEDEVCYMMFKYPASNIFGFNIYPIWYIDAQIVFWYQYSIKDLWQSSLLAPSFLSYTYLVFYPSVSFSCVWPNKNWKV